MPEPDARHAHSDFCFSATLGPTSSFEVGCDDRHVDVVRALYASWLTAVASQRDGDMISTIKALTSDLKRDNTSLQQTVDATPPATADSPAPATGE